MPNFRPNIFNISVYPGLIIFCSQTSSLSLYLHAVHFAHSRTMNKHKQARHEHEQPQHTCCHRVPAASLLQACLSSSAAPRRVHARQARPPCPVFFHATHARQPGPTTGPRTTAGTTPCRPSLRPCAPTRSTRTRDAWRAARLLPDPSRRLCSPRRPSTSTAPTPSTLAPLRDARKLPELPPRH